MERGQEEEKLNTRSNTGETSRIPTVLARSPPPECLRHSARVQTSACNLHPPRVTRLLPRITARRILIPIRRSDRYRAAKFTGPPSRPHG